MGGIGKTTIAKQVFNSISKEFEYTCFVENVKGSSIHNLEELLLDSFHQGGKRVVRGKTSWVDLERKKTLIVMDDVGSESQLKVLPELKAFGAGSHLIITTRDGGIFRFFQSYHLYRVDFLKVNEAEKLFCQYAELEEILGCSPWKDQLKRNVTVIVEKCGGLPLTLELLGCYLRGHEDDANYWEQTIDKLGKAEPISCGRNDGVWDSLKLSYDVLGQKEQKMFIEAAIYFFERPLDRALAAWNGAYGNAPTRWADLMRRSMVKVVSVGGHETVWVHEHLRDLAKSLAIGYVVSQSSEDGDLDAALDSVNANEVDENTEIVCLLNSWEDMQLAIKFEVLVKLKKLKYLEVDMVRPGGSFKNFPWKLSVLRWELLGAVTSIFPQIGHKELSNLAVLELNNWEMSKEFPESLGTLTNLRILSLCNLRGLSHLPENFGNLSHLNQLELRGLDLRRLPDSLGQLVYLQSLEIMCSTLRSLPDSLGELARLEVLSLRIPRVQALPETLGEMSALRGLRIFQSPVSSFPKSIGKLSSLQSLHISGCSILKKLPDSFGNLCSLKYLEILDSGSFESLPENFGDLSSLETLKLNARSLVSIPESVGRLRSLTYLTIKSKSLRNLPVSFGQLFSLQTVELTCDNLVYLPEDSGDLSSLGTLELKAKSLVSIPESIGRLCSLTDLTVESRRLRNLPTSFGQLSALRTLTITCRNLETLPDNFGNLSSLETLTLQLWSSQDGMLSPPTYRALRNLPSSFGKLSALKDLRVHCESLEALPDGFGNLCSLERFEIGARNLVTMPEIIGQLSSLKFLYIDATKIRNLPSSLGQLSALEDLTIRADSLVTLPGGVGNLSSPEKT